MTYGGTWRAFPADCQGPDAAAGRLITRTTEPNVPPARKNGVGSF